MSDALRRRRRLTAIIARGPPQSTHHAAGLSRLRLHATGCSATATRTNVRTSRKRTYSDPLDRAASRSLTPPGQAIGYNRKQVSSFN